MLQQSLNTMQKSLQSFSHYIPKQLVKLLLDENKEARIDGRNRLVTLFFSDIDQFCAISEQYSAKKNR